MTTRERRLRRAERLREWAEAREGKARAAREAGDAIASQIPMGQPILVGHHSEKRHRRDLDRIDNAMRATVENTRTAERQREKADNIEAAVDRAIYDDDPDAAERLREKIATLEAKRERIKRYNASARKAAKTGGVGDLSILAEREREGVATLARVAAYQLGPGAALPTYELSNLGGNIRRLRERLGRIESGTTRGQTDRVITARYAGSCADCGAAIERGQTIRYSRANGARCEQCEEE